MIRHWLKGKSVLVVGLGKSGLAAAKLLHRYGARVSVTDEKSRTDLRPALKQLPRHISIESGSARFFLKPFDLVITSPGVHLDHKGLDKQRKKGTPIWPELELAWRMIAPKCVIGVTGTNGKTTTTALIGHLLKTAGRPTVVGGNIGTPLSDLVGQVTGKTHLVLELSSYQLEAQETFHPQVAVLLNITPDHMARHGSMKNYAAAKARLFDRQTEIDAAVLNHRDAWCRRIAKSVRANIFWFPSPQAGNAARFLSLPGEHNRENAMAAYLAARAVGLSDSQIKRGLKTFAGVPHRLEDIRSVRGVRYVNDSKATNVDSTLVALKSFQEPLYLILGGEHKGSPYTPLIPLLKKKVKAVLTIGEAHPIIAKDLKSAVPLFSCRTMEKAVAFGSSLAKPGEVILLSPACASFDQYENFEERGRHFSSLVKRLR